MRIFQVGVTLGVNFSSGNCVGGNTSVTGGNTTCFS